LRSGLDGTTAALYASGEFDTHIKLSVENGSGTAVSVLPRVKSVRLTPPNPREPIAGLTVAFIRETTAAGLTTSLAPLVESSSFNKLNDGVTYSPLLQIGRVVVMHAALTAVKAARPADGASTWYEVFRGVVAAVSWPSWDSREATIRCTDLGGILEKAKTEGQYTYLSGTSLETVARDILDNNGFTGVPIYFPVATGKVLPNDYAPQYQTTVWSQLWSLAQSMGWVAYYRYRSTNTYELTFFEPARDKVVPDMTISKWWDFPQLEINEEEVRNVGYLQYYDEAGIQKLLGPFEDSVSLAKYGGSLGIRRPFWIALTVDSPIRSEAEGTDLLNAALSDVSEPDVAATVELPFPLIFGELSTDRYEFVNKKRLFESNQLWAPFSLTVEIKEAFVATTQAEVRGRASAGGRTWTPAIPADAFAILGVGYTASGNGTGIATVRTTGTVASLRLFAKVGAEPTLEEITSFGKTVNVESTSTVVRGLGRGDIGDVLYVGVVGYRGADGIGDATEPTFGVATVQDRPERSAPSVTVGTHITGGNVFVTAHLQDDPDNTMGVGDPTSIAKVRFTRLDTGAYTDDTTPAYVGVDPDIAQWSTSYAIPAAPGFEVETTVFWKKSGEELEELHLPVVTVIDDGLPRASAPEAFFAIDLKVDNRVLRNSHATKARFASRRDRPFVPGDAAAVLSGGTEVTTTSGNYFVYDSDDDIPNKGDPYYFAWVPQKTDGTPGTMVFGQRVRGLGENVGTAIVPHLDHLFRAGFNLALPVEYRSVSIQVSKLAEPDVDDLTGRTLMRSVMNFDYFTGGYEIVDYLGNVINAAELGEGNYNDVAIPIPTGGGIVDTNSRITVITFPGNIPLIDGSLHKMYVLNVHLLTTPLTGPDDRLFVRIWGHNDRAGLEAPVFSIAGVIEGPNYLGNNRQDPLWATPYWGSTDENPFYLAPPSMYQYPMAKLEALGLRPGMYVEPRHVIEMGERSADGALLIYSEVIWGPSINDPSRTIVGETKTFDVSSAPQQVIRGALHQIPEGATWMIARLVGEQDFESLAIRHKDFRFGIRETPLILPPQTPNRTAFELALELGGAQGSYEQGQQVSDLGSSRSSSGTPLVSAALYGANANTRLVNADGSPLMLGGRSEPQASTDLSVALSLSTQALDATGGPGGGGGPDIDDYFASLVGANVQTNGWAIYVNPTASGTIDTLTVPLNPPAGFTGSIKLAKCAPHATLFKPGDQLLLSSGVTYVGSSTAAWTGLGFSFTSGVPFWLVCALDGTPDDMNEGNPILIHQTPDDLRFTTSFLFRAPADGWLDDPFDGNLEGSVGIDGGAAYTTRYQRAALTGTII
jgi:hypothetical protein